RMNCSHRHGGVVTVNISPVDRRACLAGKLKEERIAFLAAAEWFQPGIGMDDDPRRRTAELPDWRSTSAHCPARTLNAVTAVERLPGATRDAVACRSEVLFLAGEDCHLDDAFLPHAQDAGVNNDR